MVCRWGLIAAVVCGVLSVTGADTERVAAAAGAEARLALRPGLEVEDLGEPARAAYVTRRFLFKSEKTNELHLGAFVMAMNRTHVVKDPPMELYDLNLATGKAKLVPGIHGRSTPDRVIAHSNGKIYVGTGRTCNLMEYDPETGKARLIGRLSDAYYQEVQYLIEGDDGTVCIAMRVGVDPALGVEAACYDPGTGQLKRLGKISAEGWFYSVAADGRYLYCGLGSRPWYLAIFDLQTGKQTVHFRPAAGERSIRGDVVQAKDGARYFLLGKDKAFALRDGKPHPLETRPKIEKRRRGRLYSIPEAVHELGLVIDVSRMLPTGWNNGELTARWRKTDEEKWRSSTVHTPQLRANSVKHLDALPGGKLIGCTTQYSPFLVCDPKTGEPRNFITAFGPFFLFDPETRRSTFLGPSPEQIWDVTALDTKVYMTGRGSLFAVFDSTKPWTYSPLDPPGAKDRNPRTDIFRRRAATNHFMTVGTDGRVYFGQRTRRGSALVWFNPATGKTGNWHEPYENRLIYDVTPINNGQLIAAATARLKGGLKGRIVIHDVATGKVAGHVEPFAGEGGTGKLMPAGPDHAIGVIPRRKKADGGDVMYESRIYKVNVRTGQVAFDRIHPGKAFAGMSVHDLKTFQSRLAVGPDGCGWLFIDRALCRIHPDDGRVEKVMDCDFAGRMFFTGNDLYFYNGGRMLYDEFAGIKRIRNVFGQNQ